MKQPSPQGARLPADGAGAESGLPRTAGGRAEREGQPGRPFSLELELPWPSNKLSPNARHAHWGGLRRAQKQYRDACYLTACAGVQKPWRGVPEHGPLLVTLVFVPPARHAYDADNLVARLKSGLDGLAKAMRVDDVRFRLAQPTIADPRRPGCVRVRVEQVTA